MYTTHGYVRTHDRSGIHNHILRQRASCDVVIVTDSVIVDPGETRRTCHNHTRGPRCTARESHTRPRRYRDATSERYDSHDSVRVVNVKASSHARARGGVVIAKTGAEFGSISTSTAFARETSEDVRHRCESRVRERFRGDIRGHAWTIRDPRRPRARKIERATRTKPTVDGTTRAHVECTQSSVKSSPRARDVCGVRDGL